MRILMVELLGVRAGFLPPGTPLPSQAKKMLHKARVTLLTKCATLPDFVIAVRGLLPPLSKRRSVAVQNKGEPRNEASPLQGSQIASHAVMHFLSGSGLTFVAALFQCLARLLPPLLSFATCLRGGDKDWTPAASNDLMDLSSRNEQNALATIYSYEGWRHDAELAETMHRKAFDCFLDTRTAKILDTMRRKQQVHNGDRSHEYIRKLDALTPTLSYSGWQDDARCIEWPTDYYRGGCYTPSQVEAQFELMRKKQAEHDGDRSHKHLRELDDLRAALDYEGWRHDAELAETMHRKAFDCFLDTRTAKILDTMRRKQQVHNGDRSHEYIRKLDALTPTLSYSGWQDDARCIEWPTDYYRGGCYTPSQVEAQFELMRKKQAEHDGDRSHKHLRELDELVARLARNMQVPSASAPLAPEAPTSSTVLWDADTLPIQRLIEEVLGGKSCALSCLGLQPHLIHPKKTIRARFRVLAIRLHPDKASHAQAAEAFIKVRAAHDRLMASE